MSRWIAVGETNAAAVESISVAEFVNRLAPTRGRVVPVVGAGLAAAAGAPSAADLIEALLTADAAATGGPTTISGSSDDLFAVADTLEAVRSEDWVQQCVASAVSNRALHPTRALMALAKARSRVVLTTNYDLSIEISAQEVGVPFQTATLATFAAALNDDSRGLVVLHLHGVCDDPSSIVLTKTSYDRILADEKAAVALKSLGSRYRFMFVGHSLADREAHIRRDVVWTTQVAYPASDTRHLLLTHTLDVTASAASAVVSELDGLMLDTYVFHDPDRLYRGTTYAAAVIAGPAAIEHERQAPSLAVDDAHYLPAPVARSDEIAEPGGRGAYMARTWQQYGATLTTHLDDRENRLMLIAGGGYGKTRELHEIAQRADGPALYMRLGNRTPPPSGIDSDVAFLQWMTHAEASASNPTSALTYEQLNDDAYVLLLDGLDEVRADLRTGVIGALNDVISAHPQHRWVVASRPIAETDLLEGFTAYTPVPDLNWVHRYAETRGVDPASVDAYVGTVPGLQDLLSIPVYAVSVVSSIVKQDPPPKTTLELLCRLADERIEVDARLPALPTPVMTWLDRLALLLELQGSTQLTEPELQATTLHTDLDIPPTPELVADLAVRALLTDTAGDVSFPANVIQEARAGRALLNAGKDGLELLESAVLVTLPVADHLGNPIRAVRSSWVNTLELMLPAAPHDWRDRVAEYDATLAARSTPTDAPEDVRHNALRTLWETYKQRRVWLDRGFSGDERDDAGALTRLAAAGTPAGFEDELKDSLTAAEPTLRANALTVIAAVAERADLVGYVRRAITDDNAVVRRQAALVAWQRGFTELAPEIAEQALRDNDEIATQTLLDMAIALSAPEDAMRLTIEAPPKHQERAWREIARRMPRGELIKQLGGPPFRLALLDVLVSDGIRVTRDDWTAQEVAELAHVLAGQGDDSELNHVTGLNAVLATHPLAALTGRLTAPPGDYFQFHIGSLTTTMTSDQLDHLVGTLRSGTLATEAQVEPPAPIDPDALAQAANYLADIANVRRSPAPAASARPTPADRQRTRIDASVTAGDFDTLLEMPPSQVLTRVDDETRAQLEEHISEHLQTLCESGELERMVIEQQVLLRDVGVLAFAAELRLPIPNGQWVPNALFAVRWHDADLRQWVRNNYPADKLDDYLTALQRLDAESVAEAYAVVPPPLPDELARVVLDALLSPRVPEPRARASVIELIDAGAGDVVRAWKPEPTPEWLLPVLVQLGDCAAEEALLSVLSTDPAKLGRWPTTYESRWIDNLRCPESADLVHEAIHAALRAGRETNDVSSLFAALERICGNDVLRRYDELIADEHIPHASFLYYRRKAALNALIEARAQQALPASSELEERIRAVVPA